MEGVSPVDLEEQYHAFVRSLESAPLVCHYDKHEAVDKLLCECLTHSFSLLAAVLFLLAHLQIHIAINCLFLPIVMMMK